MVLNFCAEPNLNCPSCWTKTGLVLSFLQVVDQVKSCFEVNTVGLELVQFWEEPVSVRWGELPAFVSEGFEH